jgi:hypothetical protein
MNFNIYPQNFKFPQSCISNHYTKLKYIENSGNSQEIYKKLKASKIINFL